MKGEKILSIEIEEKLIKIFYLSIKGENTSVIKKLIIDTPCNSYKNGYISDNTLISNKIITELKINKIKVKKARIIISSSEIVTREANIPLINLKDINSFFSINIEEYFHFDVSDYYIAYILLDSIKEKMEYSVMLIAIPNKMYKDYKEIVKLCNLKVYSISYRPFCIANFIKDRYKNSNFVAIEISNIKTNIVTVSSSIVSYNKTILNVLENNDDLLSNNIIEQLVNCIRNSLIKDEEIVLYMIGESKVLNKLQEVIDQNLNIQIIKIEKAVSCGEIDIKKDRLTFINKHNKNFMNNRFIKYTCGIIILTIIFCGISSFKIYRIEKQSEVLNCKILKYSNINLIEEKHTKKVSSLNRLKEVMDIRVTSTDKILEILNYIELNFPGNLNILSISCEENKINFSGVTDNILLIGKAIEILEKENLFLNVFVPYIDEIKIDDYNNYEFTIECTLYVMKED